MPATPSVYVILSGAGLSAPSGVPTFRDRNGLWEGHDVTEVATPEAWRRNPELVRRFYDERRLAGAGVEPNPGHEALVRLQRALGRERVALVTQNIDGLIQKAAGPEGVELVEMHGTLWKLRCDRDTGHPWQDVQGRQDPEARCACGGWMRPAVVWFGEVPFQLDRIARAMKRCTTFVAVGTSGVVYPAAGLSAQARAQGARCVEVNPQPTGGPFHESVAESADLALPRLVEGWIAAG